MANNLDAFIPEIWVRGLKFNIDQVNLAGLVMANTDYQGEISRYGDTVHVRTLGNVTVKSYARGQIIVDDDLVPTKETLVIDQSDYVSIRVDDLDEAQSDINILSSYARRAAVSLSNLMDTYLLSFHTLANAANLLTNSSSAYDLTPALAYTLLVDAGKALDDQNVPQDDRWVIVSPYWKSLLLKDTTYFIKGSDLGDTMLTTARFGMSARDALSRGFLGQIAGFDVYVSNNLPDSGANSYAVYGQGKPVSFAAQIPPGTMEAIRLQDTFATRIRGLSLYGAQVFGEDAKRLGSILVDNS